MSADSTPTGFRERIRDLHRQQAEILEAESQHHSDQVRKIMANSYDALAETWSKYVADVNAHTESVIQAERKRFMVRIYRWTIGPLVLSVAILMATLVALHWYRIETEQAATLYTQMRDQAAQAEAMRNAIETAGGRVVTRDGSIYILVPQGSEWAGTIDGLDAVKLP